MDSPIFKYTPEPKMSATLDILGIDLDAETFYKDKRLTKPMPYNGVTIALKDADGQMKSLFKEDDGKPFEKSKASKILRAPVAGDLVVKNHVYMENGKGILYVVPLYLPEHPLFKPTIHEPIQAADNLTTEAVFEVLFAFDGGLIFPAYVTEKTCGEFALSAMDMITDIIQDVKYEPADFFLQLANNGYPCEVRNAEDGHICVLYCSSATGETSNLAFEGNDLRSISKYLVSIRMVEKTETIMDSDT